MKFNISRWTASLVSIPVAFVSGLTSMLAFDIHLIYDMLVAGGGFFAAYIPTQSASTARQLKEYGLTKSEYKYIQRELADAKEKMNRMKQNYYNIRSLKDAKLMFDINRITKSILTSVQDNPKLFFNAQQFFHSNLDSAVNTTEQYLFLYKMPGKSREEKIKLHETRLSLLELKRTLQANLRSMNESTYQSLEVEKDIIRMNNKRSDKQKALDNKLPEQEVDMEKKEEPEEVKAHRGDDNGRRE